MQAVNATATAAKFDVLPQTPAINDSGEVTYSTAAASRCISLLAEDFLSWRYVKVRSGSSGGAVAQGAARSIVLVGSALA